jgi:hypothetical protein
MAEVVDGARSCVGCGSWDVKPREAPAGVEASRCQSCGLESAWTRTTMIALPLPAQTRAQLRRGELHNAIMLPVTELIITDPMASVASCWWHCRLCDHKATRTIGLGHSALALSTSLIGTAPRSG